MTPDKIITSDQQLVLKTYVKMTRALGAVNARMHRHLTRHGLTVSQFGVLEAVFHLGPLCQQEIGKKILKTSGNMTMVIDNLEKRGLAVRETDPHDRRFVQVRLTDKGNDLIRCVFPEHAGIAEEVFSGLDADELHQLGRLMKKLGTANAF